MVKWDFCIALSYRAAVTFSPVPLGEVFADKYRVDRVLGEGGMGVVVAAHHLELDQPVAIKFLLDDLAANEEGAARFRREARAAAKIQSDHVVRVLDVGVLDGGERYMVMEYLEGCDLAEELAEKRKLPIGIAAGIILEAIDAVGHAHSVGIVHRDLKPANLYLAERPDGSRRVKVLDFGISKSIGSSTAEELSLTKTSAWIGSPLYMAPEQMQSARDVDHRADIWSLGAILYEMIAGRPPYEAESLPQLCNLLITTDPQPIQALVPTIPEGLATAVMSCLVRDREKRTRSTRELGRALIAFATSITGSTLRQSLVDQADFQPNLAVPPGGSIFFGDDPSRQTEQAGTVTVASSTNAAWGATETGQKSGGSKLGWLLAALGIAGAVGFFVMSGRPAGALEAEAGSPSMAASLPAPVPEQKKIEQDNEEGVTVENSSPTFGLPSSDDPDVPAAGAPASPDSDATPAPRPLVKPRPVVTPRTANVPLERPRPAEAPQPTPAPLPQSEDDFSDFGGRR